ncbi:MAG: DUF3048 domain-containing protein [Chloroflexota bacterium]
MKYEGPIPLWFLVSILVGLLGCNGPAAEVTSTNLSQAVTPIIPVGPTASVDPTASVSPTASVGPTATPEPTATAVVSLAERETPTPTATPSPTATPAAETAVPTPPGQIGPPFAANINPLTGLPTSSTMLQQRPLAIKVSNAPAIVRPQAGLNSADLLFEHYAEGGLTRFTAVYYSQLPERVGSIRSGRFIDLEIPRMVDAAFAYSGASGPLRLMFRDSAFFERIISPDFGHGGFVRMPDPNRAFEHTLFADPANLRFILEQRGENRPPQFQNGMVFHPDPPPNGSPATRIEIDYRGTNAFWGYSNGRYQRWTDGDPHFDANSGEQLSFKNIIAIAAHHQESDILESPGSFSIQIQIWGEGPVSIFRDGQRYDGRWQRHHPDDMLTFTDMDGNALPLAPGNSAFQLVPLGFDRLFVDR